MSAVQRPNLERLSEADLCFGQVSDGKDRWPMTAPSGGLNPAGLLLLVWDVGEFSFLSRFTRCPAGGGGGAELS